jgi:TPR repeat protein
MKSRWRIAVPVGCVALICGAALTWHFVKARATERKLAADAKACRVRAEQGDSNAQYDLARLYYQGKGVPQDYAKAAGWYRKAADQGVPQDYTEAVGWDRKAADQGYARAQSALGYAYSEGKGVPQDYAQSAPWYRKAAKQGDEYAQRALAAMNIPFTAVRKIDLSAAFLWSIVLLISSRASFRNDNSEK